MKRHLLSLILIFILPIITQAQGTYDKLVDDQLKSTLLSHKEFVSIPNLPTDKELMLENINWVAEKYDQLGFTTTQLSTSTLPLLFAEKTYDPSFKTVLFYFHIDGQAVNPDFWDQEDPFEPVLKAQDAEGNWKKINWNKLDEKIDDDWRIFGRAAADDKAPIMMMLTALQLLESQNQSPGINVKIIFDPEEEYGSEALLSTLSKYKEHYAADYFIVMDGPAHDSNKPTITYGCRGIATCSITTYGAKLPQHSGHFGNYVPNPVFSLARLLTSMKDENGKVLIEDYYKGIEIGPKVSDVLNSVPFDEEEFNNKLGINKSETVGETYQESLQYPSLNVRQIGTSWEGEGLKTVIPQYATAHIDVRLVPETKASDQVKKIARHIESQGYYVIDRDPTEEERLKYAKIAKFEYSRGVNAFRTDPDSDFGQTIAMSLTNTFGEEPVKIRIMGGTVPIVPVINELNIPTLIIPMVNMDNNQHNPNENIRIGNIRQGIKMCLSILNSKL